MRGMYFASVTHTALSAAKNVWVLTVPATRAVEIWEAKIKNLTAETNEQLQFGIYRATAAGTGSATPITLSPRCSLDSSHGLTLEHTYATTQPTLGALVDADGDGSLPGYSFSASAETVIEVPPSGILVCRVDTATFAAFDCLATVLLRIIG